MKEATSKFPLNLLDHCKNFMSHWVRSEKKMFWNKSYSCLPIIWGHLKCLLPISLYSDPSSPTILLVYEIYKKKTWIPRKITKNTLIPLYYDSSQILYLSYNTTPCLFYLCNLTQKSTIFQFYLYIKMLILFEVRKKLNLLSFETRLKFQIYFTSVKTSYNAWK